MMDKQRTLKSSITFEGVGLHTGKKTKLEVWPAPDDHGYVFQRTDLANEPTIPALLKYVTTTERGTTLQNGDATISTTEHLLAALYGMQIDNALIKVSGPEVPILDGSSKYFAEAIAKVGIEEQTALKNYIELTENMKFENVEKNVEMLAVPDPEFRVTVMVDYNSPLLGTQHASMYNIRDFASEIASCRTFVFLRELMNLVNRGLIKGGDVDNAIVMVDKEIAEEEKNKLAATFNKNAADIQSIGIGILNNVSLQYENEPARHKLLDIVGDLALLGRPFKGHILAARPGHQTNIEFGKLILEQVKKQETAAPSFTADHTPSHDINRIINMLPHRSPFLLVDRIMEITDNYVIGMKNVTFNEPFFTGHFPGNPVMPGVLIVEAMAQTGGILVLNKVPDPEKYSTYFVKIDKVKFKKKVIPGDTLIIKMELIAPIRRGMCYMQATAWVGSSVVAEGELMAQVIKEKE